MAIQEADLLIALGMRFDDRVTGNLQDLRAATRRKIHIEIDPPRSTRTSAVDVALVGDLRARSANGCRIVAAGDRAPGSRTSTSSKATPRSATSRLCPTTGISTPRTSSTISGASRDGEAVVVTDVGQHQMWEAQYYQHEVPRSLITSGGLGTMGFAVPAAIGAKCARPDAEVWAVVGDGGFQMTMCELATAVQEGIDIKVAIINNGYLGHGAPVAGVLLRTALRGDAAVRSGLRQAGRSVRHPRHRGLEARRRPAGGDRGARPCRPGGRRLPRRAGGHRLSDGAGRRRSARDDSPAQSDCRNRAPT